MIKSTYFFSQLWNVLYRTRIHLGQALHQFSPLLHSHLIWQAATITTLQWNSSQIAPSTRRYRETPSFSKQVSRSCVLIIMFRASVYILKYAKSVSWYPYILSQTLQYVKYTKWINITKEIA